MNPLDKFNSNNRKHNCSLCGKEITKHAKVSIRATSLNQNTGRVLHNSYRFILCDKHFEDFRAVMGKFIQDNVKKVAKTSSPEIPAKIHADIDDLDDDFDREINELLN